MGLLTWLRGDGWDQSSADTEAPRAFGEVRYTSRYGSYGGEKWPAGMSASGHLHIINHYTARRNARNAMQDSPHARAMVERMADTVVDTGLRLEMTPVIEVLGITRQEAEEWARDVEARFDMWARDKNQHRSGTMTFYQYQRMYQVFQQRDNDMFTRLYYDSDPTLQNPLQWESIDPDQIRGDALTTTLGLYGTGSGITTSFGLQSTSGDGIERDARGRETGYNIYIRNPDGTYESITVPARTKEGRLLMLHGYRPEYSGQSRGYSRLAHAIQEFENITDFSAASIKKAINQSNIVGFVEPSDDEDAPNIFEGIMTDQGAGPAAQMFGSTPTNVPPGETVAPLYPGVSDVYRIPEATMDTPGSMFITNLTRGSKISLVGNTAPADSYDKFVDAFAGNLSASLGIPLEVVLMKFSNNYSASRATLILFWRVANGWAAEMDADLSSPIVEMWLSGEIAAGRVTAPGWSDPRLRAAWLNKNWIGSPLPDIDPAKSAKARRENVEIGLSNLDREARDLNGTSAAANIEKNKALYKTFENAPWTDAAQPDPSDGGSGGTVKKIAKGLAHLQSMIESLQD
jgi:capsid protein